MSSIVRRAMAAAAIVLVGAGCGEDQGDHVVIAPPPEPGHIITVVGTGERATDPSDADADGRLDAPIPALRARLDRPIDVALDSEGRLYVLDWNGHKIRALNDDGRLSFVIGTGVEGDACESALVDGKCPSAAAQLNHPTDVTFDAADRMIIAAWHNSKIKRLDLASKLVEEVCGTGNRKYEGDGGPCRNADGQDLVSFDLPSGVAVDKSQNILVSDQSNQVVRRLGDERIGTVAGHCPGTPGFGCPDGRGYAGDGGSAVRARLNNNLGQGADPQGKIALDSGGNLYIADTGNHVVRKVAAGSDGIVGEGDPNEEIISTVAGTGGAGYSGDGGPATQAQLSSPSDVAVADDGTLYVADRANDCIRRVDPQGTITTIAGQCTIGGFSGDGGLALQAELRAPYGIALRGTDLFIADAQNGRVRRVALVP
jgi:sugar lactone lactonase YvrE